MVAAQARSCGRPAAQDPAAGTLAQRSYNEVLTQLVTLLGDEPALRRLTPCSSSASQRSAAHEALRSLGAQPPAHAPPHAPAAPLPHGANEHYSAAQERAPEHSASGAAAQPADGRVACAAGKAGGGPGGLAPAGEERQGAEASAGAGDSAAEGAGDREEAEALAAALALSLGDDHDGDTPGGAGPPVGLAGGAAVQPLAAAATPDAAALAPPGGAPVEAWEPAAVKPDVGSGLGSATEPGGLTAQSLAAHNRRSAEVPRPPETPEAALARFEAASLARLAASEQGASEQGAQALTPGMSLAGGGGDGSARGRRFAAPSTAGATYGSQAPPSEQGLGAGFEGSTEGGVPGSPTASAAGSAVSLPAAAAGPPADVRAPLRGEAQEATTLSTNSHGSEAHHSGPPVAGEQGSPAEAGRVAAAGPSAAAAPGAQDAHEAPVHLAGEALAFNAPAATAGGSDSVAAAPQGTAEAPTCEQLPGQEPVGGHAGGPAAGAAPEGASGAAAAAQGPGSGAQAVREGEAAQEPSAGQSLPGSGGAERAAQVADARRIQAFLECSGSQLTEHGLVQLHQVRRASHGRVVRGDMHGYPVVWRVAVACYEMSCHVTYGYWHCIVPFRRLRFVSWSKTSANNVPSKRDKSCAPACP